MITTTIPDPPIVRRGAWTHDGGKIPGVRITTGRSAVFIPDEHVLTVATALADHLEQPHTKGDQ